MTRMKALCLAVAGTVAMGAGPSLADIAIATVGPMTGQYATFGEQMKRGAEAAVRDINARGGVLGQKLTLETGDGACDPKRAVAVANDMVSRGVRLVAGHYCSGSSIPASNVYADKGVIQISPASTSPRLTERGLATTFRTCGRDDHQGIVAGKFLAEKFGSSKIAILHDETTYGKGLADETRKALRANGKKETLYEAYMPGKKDYTALVSTLKQNGIDVVYLGGYHTEAAFIVRQMRARGMKTRMVSGDALVTREYWAIAGDAAEGTLMTFSPDPRKNPGAKPVVERFRKDGYEPEGYTLYTYGAIQAWAQAVERAKSTDANPVIEQLRAGTFDTVLGKIQFDAKGDVTAPGYRFYEWKNGIYDYLK